MDNDDVDEEVVVAVDPAEDTVDGLEVVFDWMMETLAGGTLFTTGERFWYTDADVLACVVLWVVCGECEDDVEGCGGSMCGG